MSAYYNENDPDAAEWLRCLMTAGLITEGVVDERDIREVQPADLAGFQRVHLFAGIGGWDYALSLAGWSGPVWTGSCPCQPFSVIGKREKEADERHLWPEFLRLVSAGHPSVIFGEQVASADGRAWLAGVFADLEALGYSRAGADLCAAGVGAPHIRQRLYWLGYSQRAGLEGHTGNVRGRRQSGRDAPQPDGPVAASGGPDFWGRYEDARCRSGKRRRIEPGVEPLAYGIPARMAQLRGLGNAIVPQLAAEFIRASQLAIVDFQKGT